MKDSKDYSPKVAKLLKTLKRKYGKAEMPTYADPIEAVVDALVSECMTQAAAARTFKRMKTHFVDLNDLRVSRKEEILDVFKDSSEAAEKSAAAITQVLNALFEKQNTVTLEALRHEGKRQAKKVLEEIPGITPFAVSYSFVTALDGHAIPLTASMLDYLRANGLVHPEATEHEIAGFLERQIAAADGYSFYAQLRDETEQDAATKKKVDAPAPAAKKAAATKTKKKTVSKKKEIKKK
jgi:endonuclease III